MLVILEAAYRALGWSLYSGSIYSVACEYDVISAIEDSGTALTAVSDIGSVTAGKYYLSRTERLLYLRTSDSVNPNSKFIAVTAKLFFSNVPVRAPYDLSTGFSVEWLAYLLESSQFGVEIDNYYQFGNAIEGEGDLTFANTIGDSDTNQDTFWQEKFDKLTFENQRALVYSWNRDLPITEAKLIYRGRIQSKGWSESQISFGLSDVLNELKAPVSLTDLSELSGARLPDSFSQLKQRRIYGRAFGVKLINYDQVVDGYPLTGTVTVVNGSANVSGSGTSFLAQLSPNDQVFIGATNHTVKSVTDDTHFVLTENYANGSADSTMYVLPAIPKRWMNRKFSIAGHALSEPSTTVTAATNPTQFTCADLSGFRPDDSVLVGSDVATVLRANSGILVLTGPLNSTPAIGTTVKPLCVSNVYLDDFILDRTTDYSYSASDGTLLLDVLAEFNVAPVFDVTGTMSFTSTSRTVTGTGTFFKKDMQPGDWVRRSSQTSYFEILSVDSDTQLTLRSASSYTSSGAANLKKPRTYREGESVLSCDVRGVTDDGTTTGAFLETCGEIVSDLITEAGLSSLMNTSTFDDADDENESAVGLVIPEKAQDNEIPSYRDIISKVNQSVFGTLVQNEDFELEYKILAPRKSLTNATVLREVDVIEFSVSINSDRLIKTVFVNYRRKEYEPVSSAEAVSQVYATSNDGQYLSKTTNEMTLDTVLVDESAAQIYANRWAFILGVGTSIISIHTKLQGARLQATDQVELDHAKLYERLASSDKRRIGAVRSVKQNGMDVAIDIEDLGNSLSRCASITDSTHSNYDDSTEQERAYAGFITDSYGMHDNDSETAGRDLIW